MDDEMHSLATKNEYPSPVAGSTKSESYPTLRLNGDQAEACGADECEHGEEYEMTIRVRCKSIGQDYGSEKKPSVTFDILSCSDCEECDEDGDDGDEDEATESDEEKAEEAKTGKEESPKSDKPGHLAGRVIII